ncbi:hypothetical protein ULMS_18700 [Patiriisocius marinistellae]|uniref:Lipoprotein n=1 Tax=Patiriisocius marinistellae TaxID=2494560 RepID=A0A5J4FYT7_9FLAO|nr:hypothetical protein [Patiriisocius marinistellae]GEQ86362.1 hypothetical protein ULMS_18700 [Patiriisocius marinistellae]
MKSIYIIILLLSSCISKNDRSDITENKISTTPIKASNMFKEIDYMEFKRNPAEDYFFTRKYKLNESQLFYYTSSNELKTMNSTAHLETKKLMDSLPKKVINDFKNLGHPTVIMDIPDWEINIHFKNEDTLLLSSGDLPDFMKAYEKMAWEVMTTLDEIKI